MSSNHFETSVSAAAAEGFASGFPVFCPQALVSQSAAMPAGWEPPITQRKKSRGGHSQETWICFAGKFGNDLGNRAWRLGQVFAKRFALVRVAGLRFWRSRWNRVKMVNRPLKSDLQTFPGFLRIRCYHRVYWDEGLAICHSGRGVFYSIEWLVKVFRKWGQLPKMV